MSEAPARPEKGAIVHIGDAAGFGRILEFGQDQGGREMWFIQRMDGKHGWVLPEFVMRCPAIGKRQLCHLSIEAGHA